MKRLKSKIASRLKSRAGETIAEVLVALLIAALAMTMLASAINSAAKIITKSKKTMSSYYTDNSALSSHTGSSEGAVSITVKNSDNETISFLRNSSSVDFTKVPYAKNSKVAGKSVISYWLPSAPSPSPSPSPSPAAGG